LEGGLHPPAGSRLAPSRGTQLVKPAVSKGTTSRQNKGTKRGGYNNPTEGGVAFGPRIGRRSSDSGKRDTVKTVRGETPSFRTRKGSSQMREHRHNEEKNKSLPWER